MLLADILNHYDQALRTDHKDPIIQECQSNQEGHNTQDTPDIQRLANHIKISQDNPKTHNNNLKLKSWICHKT